MERARVLVSDRVGFEPQPHCELLMTPEAVTGPHPASVPQLWNGRNGRLASHPCLLGLCKSVLQSHCSVTVVFHIESPEVLQTSEVPSRSSELNLNDI